MTLPLRRPGGQRTRRLVGVAGVDRGRAGVHRARFRRTARPAAGGCGCRRSRCRRPTALPGRPDAARSRERRAPTRTTGMPRTRPRSVTACIRSSSGRTMIAPPKRTPDDAGDDPHAREQVGDRRARHAVAGQLAAAHADGSAEVLGEHRVQPRRAEHDVVELVVAGSAAHRRGDVVPHGEAHAEVGDHAGGRLLGQRVRQHPPQFAGSRPHQRGIVRAPRPSRRGRPTPGSVSR